MFPPTTDYNQQLLAYLQTWRQLLEQWTTMSAGMPFPTGPSAMPTAPPFMPPMPTMPPMPPMAPTSPMPPAPGDYTQQLFGYLQAWRQYLEQMTGARPGVAQPQAGQPAYYYSEKPPADYSGQHHPVPPDRGETGSRRYPEAAAREGSSTTWPPKAEDLAPLTEDGSQDPQDMRASSGSLFNRRGEARDVLIAPDYDWGNQIDRLPTRPDTSLRREAAPRAEAPAARPQSGPKSLYSISGARVASARRPEAGQAVKRRAVANDIGQIDLPPIAGRQGSK